MVLFQLLESKSQTSKVYLSCKAPRNSLNDTKFLVHLHAILVEYIIQNKADLSVYLAYMAVCRGTEYTDGQCIILDVSLTKA